jgi:eukaryotic-like serine/threonine-protein kinase
LNPRLKKKLTFSLPVLIGLLLIMLVGLTGCVSGMTPIGWSGLLVSDGKIYTGSREGRLVSVNLADGTRKWAEPLKTASSGGSACSSGSTGGVGGCGGSAPAVAIYGTPTTANVPVYGTLVYMAGYNGKIYAYDATSLQLVWQYPVDGNLSPIVSSVVVSNNILYFGCSDKNVYALDTAKGILIWKYATGGEIWSSPVVENDLVIISSFDRKVYGLNAATGQKIWEFETKSTNVATPVTFNGLVYVGSLDRNVYALNETDGKLKWSFQGGNWFWARPYIYSGVVYAPCLDNKVYALNADSGKLVSTYDVGGQVASSPTSIGNKIIIATENKSLFWLDTTSTSGGKTLIATILPDVTAPLYASGDTIYVPGPDLNIYPFSLTSGQALSPISLKGP